MLPLILQGIISSLLTGGLPGVAKAVIDKGQEYVEEKLGVSLKPEMSSEELAKIRQEALKHEEFKIEQENKNTDSARKMNVEIQSTEHASWLAKNTAYLIDFTILGATVFLCFLVFIVGIPAGNTEIAYTALGSLLTLTGTTVNFHRGTSSGSQAKTNLLAKK